MRPAARPANPYRRRRCGPCVKPTSDVEKRAAEDAKAARKKEQGGPDGEEPTRYGDWERGGRVIDF